MGVLGVESPKAQLLAKGLNTLLVTTSKALVTRSDALVPNSFLLLLQPTSDGLQSTSC